ncbi:unnamed protein product, partial [Staurois parvus]
MVYTLGTEGRLAVDEGILGRGWWHRWKCGYTWIEAVAVDIDILRIERWSVDVGNLGQRG